MDNEWGVKETMEQISEVLEPFGMRFSYDLAPDGTVLALLMDSTAAPDPNGLVETTLGMVSMIAHIAMTVVTQLNRDQPLARRQQVISQLQQAFHQGINHRYQEAHEINKTMIEVVSGPRLVQ